MDKKILVIQNITREAPGLLSEIIEEKNISYDVVDLSKDETLPEDLSSYKALVVLGGPPSANDSTCQIPAELGTIKKSRELNIPYLGICLGLQTLVKAMGGVVRKNEVKEFSFRQPNGEPYVIDLTEEGRKDPLFEGLPDKIRVFHLHGETVDLTSEMKLLATGETCKNQVVKIGDNAYGLQCHFELTEEMLNTWINEDPDLEQFKKEDLLRDWREIKEEYINTGKTLFSNFFKIAGH